MANKQTGVIEMATTLHPIFQQVLAPFAPLLNKDGSAASPAMALLFNAAYPMPAKKPRKSTDTFHYTLAGVDLECELDFEKASGDGWNEPREPEAAYLCEAFCAVLTLLNCSRTNRRQRLKTHIWSRSRITTIATRQSLILRLTKHRSDKP